MTKEATAPAKERHGITAGVYNPTFEEHLEFSESLQSFLKKYPEVGQSVKALQGQIRSASRHAGGVIVSEGISKYMPLINSGGVTQTPWSEGQNEFRKGLEILRQAYVYAKRIDWLLSCDDDGESFLKSLKKDLEDLNDR